MGVRSCGQCMVYTHISLDLRQELLCLSAWEADVGQRCHGTLDGRGGHVLQVVSAHALQEVPHLLDLAAVDG